MIDGGNFGAKDTILHVDHKVGTHCEFVSDQRLFSRGTWDGGKRTQ